MSSLFKRFTWFLFGVLLIGCGAVAPPVPLEEDTAEEVPAIPVSGENSRTPVAARVGSSFLDARLPAYQPVSGLTGRITTVGSDTMNNLLALWVEGFKQFNPEVEFEVEGKGSSTAVPALIAGASSFGPMSRDLKKKESDDFETRFGYKPTQLATGIDMLAVYVNKDNPIQAFALPQVDAVFSKTRKLGFAREISTWGELDLSGDWANRAISLYGRNSASGTYGYFKDHVLGGGDFKDAVKEQPGSSSVIQAVGSDPGAIGYSGIGYQTADVRPVPLAAEVGEPPIAAEPANAYNGKYPLARYLWLTVNYRPGSELKPLQREFIKYVLSREGQEQVVKDGYLPLPAKEASAALALVGIKTEG